MKFTIKEFNAQYENEDKCLHEIFIKRFGHTKKCPACKKATKFHRVSTRKCYVCQFCGYQIHPLADTIFHKSETPLKSWFYAIFLFSNSKNGVSAMELKRQLGVTYKCAWRMAKQIRTLFATNGRKLSKTVEVDETYIGGKSQGKRGRGAEGKTPVFGMVQRGGNIKAQVVLNTKASTLLPLMQESVKIGTRIMSDEYPPYNKVRSMGYFHRRINHGAKQYVRGLTHVNTIEGFWSQLKRSINGTYHAVSSKYLQSYVDEFAWRFDRRNVPMHPFFSMMESAARP